MVQITVQSIISTLFDFDVVLMEQGIFEMFWPVGRAVAESALHKLDLDKQCPSHLLNMIASKIAISRTRFRVRSPTEKLLEFTFWLLCSSE